MKINLPVDNHLFDEFLNNLSLHQGKKNLILPLIEELKTLGEIIQVPAETYLLKEGDINTYLYFLLDGSLKIILDGETVAQLNNHGDLVGEMSIISDSPCTANVLTAKASNVLKVPVQEFKKESPTHQLLFYKIFCLTLRDKLENTNVKAKKFEALNRTLEDEVKKRTNELTEKNNELTLGYKKLEYMQQEVMSMVSECSRLNEDYLTSALKQINDLQNQGIELKGLRNNLEKLQESLLSLQKIKVEQENLKGQKVLVIEANTKQKNLVKTALAGTGVHTKPVSSIDEAKASLAVEKYDIIFLSSDLLEEAEVMRQTAVNAKIVLLTKEGPNDFLSKVANYEQLSNIIALKEENRSFNIKSISTTVKKMISGNIFGLEKYLNWGAEIKQFEIHDSQKRGELNDKIMAELAEMGVRGPLRNRCQVVIEELLMNAIYDAPIDAQGNPLHNNKSRKEHVVLTKDQGAKLKFATDGILLAVSVEDPFGGFKKETVLRYLAHNYEGKTENISEAEGKGGAGKGLFMITENSDLVVFNVSPKIKTEVIALFDLDPDKDRKKTSLHYFEI
jgi:CRP-like cAMP-binding protein/nitrate reductase NapAB chaperone NapD